MKAYEGVDVKFRQSWLSEPGEYGAQASLSINDGQDKISKIPHDGYGVLIIIYNCTMFLFISPLILISVTCNKT
jgi:hypothetical protein